MSVAGVPRLSRTNLNHSSDLFGQAISVYQDRDIYSPEKARALYKRSKVHAGVGKLADATCDEREALRLYRLAKPHDTRPLSELGDLDFDSIIVFWSR